MNIFAKKIDVFDVPGVELEVHFSLFRRNAFELGDFECLFLVLHIR